MQSVLKQQPKLRLSLIAVACHLACLGVAHAQTVQEKSESDAGTTREVVITGKKTNMGLMVQEDAPKARSTITAAELERQRPTGNAYQALELLPSVNSFNYDATGLFGGGLTLRGFNSDQIGATINGVPVNDSGSFAVYPQEYVDQENTCTEFVTQGSTDVDSPQVGASGGNFGIITCNPEDKQRVRFEQTLGQLDMYKSFVRYDTGLLPDGRSKAFISVSRAKADKWKGDGVAQRDHVDAGFNYDWDRFNYVHATVLFNNAHNNNINSLSLAQINQYGYDYDFANTFQGHLTPVAGTAQVEKVASTYYALSNNPFKNAIASATAKFRLSDNLDLKVVPYYWYGFGTGGNQEYTLSESGFLTGTPVNGVYPLTGTRDLNGDGDTKDTVIYAESSVTRTGRPGMTTSLTYTIGNNTILGGVWWERAHHEQTAPGELVANNGSIPDVFLQDNQILRPNGDVYEYRDWVTISTAYQGFIQDTLSLMDDKLTLNFGLRTPHIKRDFTNYANESAPETYRFVRTYSSVLPQFGIRYRLTNDDQLYASIAKNFKAPGNFVYATSNGNVAINTKTGAVTVTRDVMPETSYSLDAGFRHQTNAWNGTFDLYATDFQNRMATSYDPVAATSSTTNVGAVRNYGFEIEAGNTPIKGWSAYVSYGYNHSKVEDDIQAKGGILPTAGKEFPLTPKQKAGLSLMYQTGPAWARLSAKATGQQAATLTNDEMVPGYTAFNLDGGYTFQNWGYLKNPKLTFNVSNLTNREYRNPSSQSVLNAKAYGAVTANTVYYYLAAPRFTSVTLQVDF